jgi:hypothetical protein
MPRLRWNRSWSTCSKRWRACRGNWHRPSRTSPCWETQLAESRSRAAEAEQASARIAELWTELRQQKATFEVQLDGAKDAITLEERLAKLDKAVFGTDRSGQSGAKAAEAD